MSTGSDKWVTKEQLRQLADKLGIELDDQRTALAGPEVERFLAGLLKLDDLALGEEEPAITFVLSEEED